MAYGDIDSVVKVDQIKEAPMEDIEEVDVYLDPNVKVENSNEVSNINGIEEGTTPPKDLDKNDVSFHGTFLD